VPVAVARHALRVEKGLEVDGVDPPLRAQPNRGEFAIPDEPTDGFLTTFQPIGDFVHLEQRREMRMSSVDRHRDASHDAAVSAILKHPATLLDTTPCYYAHRVTCASRHSALR
jgi:hypothetical protein